MEFSDGIHLSEDWAAIDYEGCTGYISSDFISVDFEVDSGETLQEIAAREAAQTKAITASAETAKGGRTKPTHRPVKPKENAGVVPAGVSDAQLLAALIQCEAGGESYEGQLAVGAVVINRVRSGSYPSTISGVIYASGQFGPAGTGKVASLLSSGNIKNSCLQAANEAINGITNVGNATHFRRAGNREGIVIGNHVFW
ncbi:MAG: cell wall hydrolase [[Clostridium] leptum]